MTTDELLTFIDSRIKVLGYRKKSKSWHKENPETTTMFSLSQSRWGKIYFVILSAHFKKLSSEKNPKFYQSHVQLRAEDFGENTEEYLNLDKVINENSRKKMINVLIDKSIPILTKMETEAGFKLLLKEYNPRLFMLSIEVQKYLGIQVD